MKKNAEVSTLGLTIFLKDDGDEVLESCNARCCLWLTLKLRIECCEKAVRWGVNESDGISDFSIPYPYSLDA